MNHLFSVTKTFENLPVAHCQFQDINDDGTPGACSALHGYDRSVTIEISADQLDEYGWVFPFGAFKKVRNWLEFYFDHTSVFPANDPRLDAIRVGIDSGFVGTARILPYGVSMEMSSLFLFEQANRYIYEASGERACITKIEFREHQKNAGHLVINYNDSIMMARDFKGEQLVMKPEWEFEWPATAINRILPWTYK